jgi:hypothetical protein
MALSKTDPKCPFLVQHEGQPLFDFEKAWAMTCKAAGFQELCFTTYAGWL